MEANPDFRDLLRSFNAEGARYLVVGAYALAFHMEPRFTKDVDVWIDPTRPNAEKVWRSLAAFGAPLTDVTLDDLCNPELVYQIGVEPNRVDVLMGIDGVQFPEAWERRVRSTYGGETVYYLSREDLVRNKEATGRPEDRRDAEALKRTP